MPKYRFQPQQRYAIYTVHGGTCYLCGTPIDLRGMEVDHVIPESLIDDSARLEEVRRDFNLPPGFDLNGYENWMPACATCNNQKRNTVFRAVPVILVHLERATKYAEKTREIAESTRSKQQVMRALNILLQAAPYALHTDEELDVLRKIGEQYYPDQSEAVAYKRANPIATLPEIETDGITELRLTPLYTILHEEGAMRIVQAPYGIGYQPTNPNPHSSFRCGHCGSIGPWQGARCMTCGHLDDGD